jgi:TolB-like protein
MADVFVSYARADQPLVEKIAQALTSAGFTAWWDTDLLPHSRFANVIEEEIRAARAVLVCWSQAAIESQWVRAEADVGRSDGKLIQVVIGDCSIPMPFNQYQSADLRGWHGDAGNPQWRKVLASVAHFKETPAPQLASPSLAAPADETPRPRWFTAASKRMLVLMGVAVIAVGAGTLAVVENFGGQPARGTRIAIQPFRTIGSSPGLADFAAGLSDSLQNVLTQDQLQTLSSEQADTLKGDDLAGRAKSLGVGLIFSGTVKAADTDIGVSMRLDDPVQQATLWTRQMSAPAVQSAQLQASVGALTVAVLNCSSQALSPTVRMSDGALQAFLHACELSETADHGTGGGAPTEAMLEAMRQATRAAPDFAAGHSMLSKHLAYVAGQTNQPSLRAEAEREARRALELDPKDPDGFVTLGLLAPELDFSLRERLFRSALAADPAWPHANGFLGNVMSDVGRLQDALTLYQRAAVANPQSIDWTEIVAAGLIEVDQTAAADRILSEQSKLWPDDLTVWLVQFQSMVAQKRWVDALKVLDRAGDFGSAVSPDFVAGRRALLSALQSGDASARSALREKLLASGRTDPENAISDLSMLGFTDDAFDVARHTPAGGMTSPGFLFEHQTSALRRDPRFVPLAARFGLIDYWRRTGRWPDFCSDASLPYNCAQEAGKLAVQRKG